MKIFQINRHLRKNDCVLVREGKHTTWQNKISGRKYSIPRHNKINKYTLKTIYKKLGVSIPNSLQKT